MAVFELFSTRQKRSRGEVPDVYSYDSLPYPLRVQIVHIWRDGFGTVTQEGYGVTCPVLDGFREIQQILCKEYGVFALTDRPRDDAFTILAEKRFRAANEEFGKAHQHYRQRRYQESIADCLKAFESTMKVICATHKWPSNPGDTAKALIKTCFDHDLIPGYLESQFASLRSVLESGVPTIRNKTSGHGQGESYSAIPAHLVAYALHLTASNILFLDECEKELP